MYAQLGNIVFDGLKGFGSYNSSSEESFPQHERINSKPLLQHTGAGLEQLNITVRLHVSFCTPKQELQALIQAKEAAEVLPYISGSGRYEKDYVITSLSVNHEFADKNGELLSCLVSLNLLEYVTGDRLFQQELSARKSAFAVGDKRPIAVSRTQPATDSQKCVSEIGQVNQMGNQVDSAISVFEENFSQRPALSYQIETALNKMEQSLTNINTYINNTPELNFYKTILDAVANIKAIHSRFQFPITDISSLKRNNTDLQSVIRTFRRTSIALIQNIVLRKQ